MLKFIIYTILFSVGGYYAVQALPVSFKERALAAIGFGYLKDKSMEVFEPALKREEIIEKLEQNITALKNASASRSGQTPENNINIIGPTEQPEIIKKSEELITQLKDLNPKTGLMPQVIEKVLGLQPPLTSDQKVKELISQLPPDVKEQICQP